MQTLLEKEEYKGCTIEIHYDECCENPFEDWDAMGKISFHPRSDYVCNTDPSYNEASENKYAIPLDAYIHSGIALSVAGEGYQCQWDTSSHIAIWTPDAELNCKNQKDAAKYARQACELFNQWANNEVYFYIVEDQNGNTIDSCGGYYGSNSLKDAIDNEVKPFIDEYLKDENTFIGSCFC